MFLYTECSTPTEVTKKPHELQSKLLKVDYIGNYTGDTKRIIKGDARSLDYSPHVGT